MRVNSVSNTLRLRLLAFNKSVKFLHFLVADLLSEVLEPFSTSIFAPVASYYLFL